MQFAIRPLAHGLFVIGGLLLCVTSQATAQGRIRGLVTDRDGAPVVGAVITAEQLAANRTSLATTDASGRFSFIGLNRGEWVFVVRADGFEPVQGVADIRGSGPSTAAQFTMDRDLFNPPAPTAGVLAGLKATDLVESLGQADRLFDTGDYELAITAYQAVLASAPALTSLHLEIGHAHRELQQWEQAVASYRAALAADPSSSEAAAALDLAGVATRDR